MIKRDFCGLLHIYSLAGSFLLVWGFCLSRFISNTQRYWAQNNLVFRQVDICALLLLLFALRISLFLLVRSHQNWLRLERARQRPDALPLYKAQPSHDWSLHGEAILLSLKTTMARREATRMIQAFSVCLLLLLAGLTLVALVHHTQLSLTTLLPFGLIFAASAALFALITGLFALGKYEYIEANEHGLLRQKGVLRHHLLWDTLRLFAVGGKARQAPEWIELSSQEVLLRWPFLKQRPGWPGKAEDLYLVRETPDAPYKPITRHEYEDQLLRLYGYIQMKTRLSLRDLRPR